MSAVFASRLLPEPAGLTTPRNDVPGLGRQITHLHGCRLITRARTPRARLRAARVELRPSTRPLLLPAQEGWAPSEFSRTAWFPVLARAQPVEPPAWHLFRPDRTTLCQQATEPTCRGSTVAISWRGSGRPRGCGTSLP